MRHSRAIHAIGTGFTYLLTINEIGQHCGPILDAFHVLQGFAGAESHDTGHSPWSHDTEHALETAGIHYRHETMSVRLLTDPESQLARNLARIDPRLGKGAAAHVESSLRTRWLPTHRLVSGPIDTDRKDYTARDAWAAGFENLFTGEDIRRLAAATRVIDGELAIDLRALPHVMHFLSARHAILRRVEHRTGDPTAYGLQPTVCAACLPNRPGPTSRQ